MTLGFRWSGFFNRFWKTSFIGMKEWLASKAENSLDKRREHRNVTLASMGVSLASWGLMLLTK